MTEAALQLISKEEEFEEMFKEQFPLVHTFIFHHSSNAADAEDLTAEVFIRAYRYWDSYSPQKGSRGEWICGIARNTIKTYSQKKALGFKTIELSELIATDDDIESDYLHREYLRHVFALINALPERQRELLTKKYIDGFTNRDIAEAMGMSADNVGVTLYRTIKKLKSSLRNY